MDIESQKLNDEEIVFAEEIEDEISCEMWKVLIVDDEREVHRVTKLAFDNFIFEGRKLYFYNAFSADEAYKIMEEENDIAVILLDVVMEEKDSGLKFAKRLREELGNKLTRIILRTGQPGDVLNEEKVTFEYDINDYKTKTELNARKLTMTMLVALRSYRDLMIIENKKVELKKHKEHLEELVDERTKSLKLAQEQLIISEKIASVGKFVSGISHELNSPLVGIMTNIELIKIDAEDINEKNIIEKKESIKEQTALIMSAAKKSRDIILNLQKYTEKKSGKLSEVNITSVIQQIKIIYQNISKENGILMEFGIENEWEILGNGIELLRVFCNIIDNSIYYLNKLIQFKDVLC